MYDEDRDWDNEAEHARERDTDRDYQRMRYADQFGPWDTPEERAAKQAEMDRLYPRSAA